MSTIFLVAFTACANNAARPAVPAGNDGSGTAIQAQNQFNRMEALGYDRNNAIRSLGKSTTQCITYGNNINCRSY